MGYLDQCRWEEPLFSSPSFLWSFGYSLIVPEPLCLPIYHKLRHVEIILICMRHRLPIYRCIVIMDNSDLKVRLNVL